MQNTEQFAQTIAQSLLGAEADHPARPLIAMRGIRKSYYIGPVSYTHLTLPTTERV